MDLTGGEIFLRPDIDEILDAVVTGWRRLALLHFPTNGFLTDRIVASAQRIASHGPGQTVITVSVDGNEELNDDIRGIKGGFAARLPRSTRCAAFRVSRSSSASRCRSTTSGASRRHSTPSRASARD